MLRDALFKDVYLGFPIQHNVEGMKEFIGLIRTAIQTEACSVLVQEIDSRRQAGKNLISKIMMANLIVNIVNYVEDHSVVPDEEFESVRGESPWSLVNKLENKMPGLFKDIKLAMHKFIKEEEARPKSDIHKVVKEEDSYASDKKFYFINC